MNETTRLRLMLGGLVAAGAVIFSVSTAGAQFSSHLLEVTGIGGRPVTITGDVAASVSTGDGVYLAVAGDNAGARLQVEATGIGGGAVQTALTTASLSALNGRLCVPGGQGKVGVDGAVHAIPPLPGDGGTGAQLGRTSISIIYPSQGKAGFISCAAGGLDAGPTPLCDFPVAGAMTSGWPVDEGGSAELEVSGAYVLLCRACTSSGGTKGTGANDRVSIGFIEQDCDQFQ